MAANNNLIVRAETARDANSRVIDELIRRIRDISDDIENLEQNLEESRAEIEQLKGRLFVSEKETTRLRIVLERKIKNLKEEQGKLEEEKRELEEENQKLNEEFLTLNSGVRNLKQHNIDLRNRQNESNKQVEELRFQIRDLRNKSEKYNAETLEKIQEYIREVAKKPLDIENAGGIAKSKLTLYNFAIKGMLVKLGSYAKDGNYPNDLDIAKRFYANSKIGLSLFRDPSPDTIEAYTKFFEFYSKKFINILRRVERTGRRMINKPMSVRVSVFNKDKTAALLEFKKIGHSFLEASGVLIFTINAVTKRSSHKARDFLIDLTSISTSQKRTTSSSSSSSSSNQSKRRQKRPANSRLMSSKDKEQRKNSEFSGVGEEYITDDEEIVSDNLNDLHISNELTGTNSDDDYYLRF